LTKASYGISYHDEEIKETIESFGLKEHIDYQYLSNDDAIAQKTAELISRNKVVAWFQGGSELGPRALGNRSILFNIIDPEANATTLVDRVPRPLLRGRVELVVIDTDRVVLARIVAVVGVIAFAREQLVLSVLVEVGQEHEVWLGP